MKKYIIKSISLLSAVILLSSSLAGCQNKDKQTANQNTQGSSTQQEQGAKVTYPLKTNVTLKYWTALNGNVSQVAPSLGETPYAKELEKRTGVKIEYIHPAAGQETVLFNMLLASGDLPDIIEYGWLNAAGGADKCINQGYITKLNDVIANNAPNLQKVLKENPDIDKMVKTDSGAYYAFPSLTIDPILRTYYGSIMRKDWLDELNLQVPTTIDEWYTVLKAFKEKKNVESPLSYAMTYNIMAKPIIGAFTPTDGVGLGFFVDNGKVKYNNIQPEYKEFLTTFRKWYTEGLVDKNFSTNDVKKLDSNVLNGKSGAFFQFASSGVGRYMAAAKGTDPKFDLVGVPYPTLKKGEKPKSGQLASPYYTTNGCAAISKSSKNVEVAARFLDYAYSNEGKMFFTFGTENETYKMVNNEPVYTDLILNNPDKLTTSQALAKYTRNSYQGPFAPDSRYFMQINSLPQQRNALSTWVNTDVSKYLLPPVSILSEESTEYNKISTDIKTYSEEMYIKFVMGIEPLDKFDDYVQQAKKIGIDRLIEINQAALDRFNKR